MNTLENMIFLNLKYAIKSCVIYMPLRETFEIEWVCHEVVQVSVMEGHYLITKCMQRVRAQSCLILGILFVLIFAVC